jgi:hypothetical protein
VVLNNIMIKKTKKSLKCWDVIIDFTKIRSGGVDVKEILSKINMKKS